MNHVCTELLKPFVSIIYCDVYHKLDWLRRNRFLRLESSYHGSLAASLRELLPESGNPHVKYEAWCMSNLIIGSMLRGNCSCSRKWLPPNRSALNFWQAVERCEREHQVNINDLVHSGLLQPGRLERVIVGEQNLCGDLNAEEAAPCPAVLAFHGQIVNSMSNLLCKNLNGLFPQARPFRTDANFWHVCVGNGNWQPVSLDMTNPPSEDLPLLLHGWYLSFELQATVTTERRVVFQDTDYADLCQAAKAAREHVAEALKPYHPCHDWKHESASIDELRTSFWHGYAGAVNDADREARWCGQTSHYHGNAQYGLNDFLIQAAVGSPGPGMKMLNEFLNSMMFWILAAEEKLDRGTVLYCKHCRRESDGRCHDRQESKAPVGQLEALFVPGSKDLRRAFHCSKADCGHYWYVADVTMRNEVCPLCDSGPRSRTNLVWGPPWRPARNVQLPLDADEEEDVNA